MRPSGGSSQGGAEAAARDAECGEPAHAEWDGRADLDAQDGETNEQAERHVAGDEDPEEDPESQERELAEPASP